MPNPLLLWATVFPLRPRSALRAETRGRDTAFHNSLVVKRLLHRASRTAYQTALTAAPRPAAPGARPLHRPKATTHAPHFRPREVGGGSLTRLRSWSPGFRAVQARWV